MGSYMGNLSVTQGFVGSGDLVEDSANVILIGNGISLHWSDVDTDGWVRKALIIIENLGL